jgi:hypothetical protein
MGAKQTIRTPAATTLLIRDGQNVLQETDGTGATQAEYTNAPGMWGGLTSQRRDGESTYYGFDMSSNTRDLTDYSAAEVAAYLYDAFGVRLDGGAEAGYIGSPIQVMGMDPGFGGSPRRPRRSRTRSCSAGSTGTTNWA